MTPWSRTAWEAALPVYRQILTLPFVRELAAGTVDRERFAFYLGQDSLYLDVYSRVLAHTASRLASKDHVESFLRFALDGVEVERAMHSTFLKGDKPREMTPACLLYTSVLRAAGASPVEVEAASVLPCFWIYQEVGRSILSQADLDTNPYSQWISTYADPTFAASAARAIAICDELAAGTTDDIRRAMTDIFVRCAKMEWLFWHSAYSLEKWKI